MSTDVDGGPRYAGSMSDRKTMILTGASRGIGHATVKRFSREGWRIITCSREEVPEDEIEKEREIHRQWAIKEGKPEKALDNIVTGRMDRFYQDVVLLDQPFIRDSNIAVRDLVHDAIGKLGENIVVKRFIRYRVGE